MEYVFFHRLMPTFRGFRAISRCFVLGGILAVALAGCATDSASPDASSRAVSTPTEPALAAPLPGSYAALGASETYGVGAAPHIRGYAYQVAHALGATHFVDEGIPGATLNASYETELTNALAIRPALATVFFGYNDLASLERIFHDHPGSVAAVLMEPIGVEAPHPGFLEAVRDLCTDSGALLIFDEIITGFRLDMGGAQAYFGVTPDLACFGKALANGLPLAAVVGKRDQMLMFDEIFFSGTFGGETLSLAACKATIEEMKEKFVIAHNWAIGKRLTEGLNELIARHGLNSVLKVAGLAVRSVMTFPNCDEREALLRRSFVMQECVKRGLLYFGSNNISFAHNEPEVQFTLHVFADVMPLVAAAYQAGDFAARMEGLPAEPIFRRA